MKPYAVALVASIALYWAPQAVDAAPKPYYNKWFDTAYEPYIVAYEGDMFDLDNNCSGGALCDRWGTHVAGYLEDAIDTKFKTPGSTAVLNGWVTQYYDIEQHVWRSYNGDTSGVDYQGTGIAGTYRWYEMYESSDIDDWNRGHECGYANPLSALRWSEPIGGGWYLMKGVEIWEIDDIVC